MAAMKFTECLVVWRGPTGQIAGAEILADALLHLARGAHVDPKTIEPHFQHQSRIVGSLPAGAFFLFLEAAQIERFHHLMHQEQR